MTFTTSGKVRTSIALDKETHTWLTENTTGGGARRPLQGGKGMINFRWVERYVERGFACHWLHGKAPYQQNWPTLPVATFWELKRSYRMGNNLGVRVGKWSVLEPGFGLVVRKSLHKVQSATRL